MRKTIHKQKKGLKIAISLLVILAVLVSVFFGVNYKRYLKQSLTSVDFDTKTWMSLMDDDTPLGQINIPGSHDAAAINPICKDAFARHYTTITEQLESGIRLLDLRIQYKQNKAGAFDFLTCHGNIGSAISLNTYAPLSSVLTECDIFLESYPSETIVLSIKIDDNQLETEEERALCDAALKALLEQHKIRPYQEELGTLKEARGQMILFNRINQNVDFGYPMYWKDNFDGLTAANGDPEESWGFSIGVQDHYNFGLMAKGYNAAKTDNVFNAMQGLPEDYDVLFNFASACTFGAWMITPYPDMVERLGEVTAAERPEFMGWIFMDYEDTLYETEAYGNVSFVSLIIDSNLLEGERYRNYQTAFSV